MTQYNVHLYRELRLVFDGIEADTPQQAATIARDKPTDEAVDIEDCEGESLAALVDVVGDDQFEQSVTVEFEGERQRRAAPALLAALQAVIDYAESEAHSLANHKDSPECEAEAERAWKAVAAAQAAITEANAAGILPAPSEMDVHALLAERRQIAELWGVLDMKEVRPDLTDDQAWQVLQAVRRHYDPAIGITWDVLWSRAETTFGPAPAPHDAVEA